MNEPTDTTLDMSKVEQFAMQGLGDQSAVIGGVMVYLGDRLGLYKAMLGAGSSSGSPPPTATRATGTAGTSSATSTPCTISAIPSPPSPRPGGTSLPTAP